VDVFLYVQGLLFVWNTHLMTHYCNEYYDLEPDKANVNPSPWTGGSRVLVKGLVAPHVSLRIAYALAAASTVMALLMPTLSAKLLCLGAVFLSWEYSAPPFKLEGKGMGELIVTAVLNTIVPLLGFCLQEGGLTANPLLLILVPLGIIEYIRMMVMNMADWRSDATTWKKTLVVRIGIENAVRIHGVGMGVAYLSLIPVYLAGVPAVLVASVALTGAMGLWYAAQLQAGAWKDPKAFFPMPYIASTHNGLSGAAALFGLILMKPEWSLTDLEFYPLYLYFSLTILFRTQASLRQRNAAPQAIALEAQQEPASAP
jgi:1,4-dihydroxy-2-naphthoate octaprenyltransferase